MPCPHRSSSLTTRLLDPPLQQEPIHRHPRRKPHTHTHLHHPPINPRPHLQPAPPDTNLKRNHPAKSTNLKARQTHNIGFGSAPDGFGTPFAAHGCDAEVLERNAKEERECVVD